MFCRRTLSFSLIAAVSVPPAAPLAAHEDHSFELPPIVVIGRSEDMVGSAATASQGRVGQKQIGQRPILRPGEVMETVPGVIATQHSGTGKANQYFLRGFNLDHGTDFSVTVDGAPVNMPTHGHGQGYLDVNFLIPELIESVEYKKGPYYAEVGDFSSAGAVEIRTADELPGLLKLEGGEDNFGRAVLGKSFGLGAGRLLVAADGQYYNGPWDSPEHLRRFSGMAKYSRGDRAKGLSLALHGYSGEWDATDQIPQRAVDSGRIGRLGTLDPTDGGTSARSGLTASYWDHDDAGATHADIYCHNYRLDLWSNFTFFQDDPANGDQFQQVDRRTVSGGAVSRSWRTDAVGEDTETTLGVDARYDHIPEVALRKTRSKDRLSTVRQDHVKETKSGAYLKNQTRWAGKFRSIAGLRYDAYWFDVESQVAENSGSAKDQILSPKLGVVVGPWDQTEYYASYGLGFHSNDARGTTIAIDPSTLAPADKVDPLVRSRGMEAGVRTSVLKYLRTTLAFWRLDLDSELLFVGDAGLTEPSRPSRRHGVEWANFYEPLPWLAFDADLSLSRAKFRDDDPAGPEIPGAIERVVSAGVTAGGKEGAFGAFRVRHFGPRPLVEDDTVRSDQSTLCNARAGWKKGWLTFAVDVLNVFDVEDHDVDYYYSSQLSGEASPVDDIHFHPVEPRTVRASVTARF
jgi:outer membrane receptor protein involved in Fe transport